VVANPLAEAQAFLAADLPNLPAGTTKGTGFPAGNIAAPYIQYAWDGTPSDADNREDTVARFTVWTPRGRVTEAQDIAGSLRARLLAWSSANTWAVERGAGRLPGIDPDTKLPFCTFTVSLVLHALTT
jgi:hypothetical protein